MSQSFEIEITSADDGTTDVIVRLIATIRMDSEQAKVYESAFHAAHSIGEEPLPIPVSPEVERYLREQNGEESCGGM
jgi:hypothetical protein